jgi:hypothetical protein
MVADGEGEPPDMGTFVLHLRLGGFEPPSGMIGTLDELTIQPFQGWIRVSETSGKITPKRWGNHRWSMCPSVLL